MPCEAPCIHPRDIISNSQVRKLCGGVVRGTLIRWRRLEAFPAPVRTVPGPGSSSVELWDRREVKAWCKRREERTA